MILYFAYGSNMNCRQMTERCPSAAFFGIAKLKDHEFFIARKSKSGYGVASVQTAPGKDVWGVVYEVPESEMRVLDEKEGYRPGRPKAENSYVPVDRDVLLNDDESRICMVRTYIANAQDDPPLPNRTYINLITSGARFWHLPDDYISSLESIEVAS